METECNNSVNVGAEIKTLRLRLGYSQRELARRSGLTHATISMIENGRIDPSLGTLRRLLTSCHVKMSDFFRSLEETKNVFREQEIATVSSGGVHMRYITPRNPECVLEITQELYDPGADTGEERLEHEGQEGGLVIRGTFELTLADQIYVLNAGDSYYFSSSTPHRFKNIGEEPGELVNAASPPTF